jgi:type VI secretion system ImpC/EvpB family protein
MKPEPAENSTSFEIAGDDAHAAPRPAPVQASPTPSILDDVVEATAAAPSPARDRLAAFLDATSVRQSLREWFGTDDVPEKDRLVRRLNRHIAIIDGLLNDQLNAVLHAKPFQKLEATWRGVQYLVDRVDLESDDKTKVRVLSVTWRELEKDFERAVEFDQSQTFKKVYEDEFGMPGGEPFGCLIADYEIQPAPGPGHPHDDISVLRSLAEVGAAAFCPIITNASPAMFGLDDFAGLQHSINHQRVFSQLTYRSWRSFRQSEHARFVGMALPRVLMRLPYGDDGTRVDRFPFQEDVSGPDNSRYLWGGAAFAMGEVLIRAFAQAGWLADIRGVRRNEERGGLVTGLPVHHFDTDKTGIAVKSSTDVVITDHLEKSLSDLGFIPLCDCKDTEYSAFYSNQSAQIPKKYDRPEATVNARISAMLQYMLCVSRFAHYVKVIGREKTGSFTEVSEFEEYVHRWIVKYVTPDSEATPDVKARHPLREASVQVYPVRGKPGCFDCTLHLSPHYELDEVKASVRLQAELTKRVN